MSKYFDEDKIKPIEQDNVDEPTPKPPYIEDENYDDDIEEREDIRDNKYYGELYRPKEPEVGMVLRWIEKGVQLVKKYKFIDFMRGFILVVAASFAVYVAANPARFFEPLIKAVIERYEADKNEDHYTLIEQRVATSPIIQARCNELLYKVGASRVLFF